MANLLIEEKMPATNKTCLIPIAYWLKQQLGAVCSLGHIQACICPGSGSQSNCNHSGDIFLLNLICAGKSNLYEGDFYSSHRIQSIHAAMGQFSWRIVHITVPLRPSDSDFSQNWKPGIGEIPLLFFRMIPRGLLGMNHRQSPHHSSFDKPVVLHR
jgi:hypothetical protein